MYGKYKLYFRIRSMAFPSISTGVYSFPVELQGCKIENYGGK